MKPLLLLLLLCSTMPAGGHRASAEAPLVLSFSADTMSIRAADSLLALYPYLDVPAKPYVREWFSGAGINVLLDAPPDHLHHHGLMFAMNINGTNFWEEALPESGRQAHQAWTDLSVSEDNVPKATCTQILHWIEPKTGAILAVEHRRLGFSPGFIDWQSTLTVPPDREKITLGGYHYHGLGMRFRQEEGMPGAFRWAGDASSETVHGDEKLTRSPWSVYESVLDNKPFSVVMLDHPDNPRPALWFSMGVPFAYLSATINLWREPLELVRGESLTLRYGVLLADGQISDEQITKTHDQWTRSE